MNRADTQAWIWPALAGLALYQGVMYGWGMRVYVHYSVVLMPWLLRQPGFRLYDNVVMQHAPGSMWLGMALYALIPDPLLRVRLGMVIVTALALALVFWLARKWWGTAFGLLAATLYALWGPVIMDRPMYFEVMVGLLALGALVVWHESGGAWWRPLLAGLLVGAAILFKQQALALVVVFAVWRLFGLDWGAALADAGRFALGAALPVGAVLGVMAAQGRLADMLFWTWTFNFGPYLDLSPHAPPPREWLLLAAWLGPVPLLAFRVARQRDLWRRAELLMLGLAPALALPVFPAYARMHLSGAVPVVALIGAGAAAHTLSQQGNRRWLRVLNVVAVGLPLLLALALPTYYRLRLGPRTGEYEALVWIGDWVAEETNAPAGTRVWMLPEIDPTDNFYAVTGYLPPTFWVQSYNWFHAPPGLTKRVIDGLDSDPPRYAVLVEAWRGFVPERLLTYLEAHYRASISTDAPFGVGSVSLYELAE